jgi:hypothetical protein
VKKINIFYWICTGILIPALGIGSAFGVVSDPGSVQIVTSLGYPAYLVPFLSLARLLGLAVIVIPKLRRLKEWAYAGLAFDIIGAMYSQMAIGNPVKYLVFLFMALLFLFGSYLLYHRRLLFASKLSTAK